jgi:ferredoxin
MKSANDRSNCPQSAEPTEITPIINVEGKNIPFHKEDKTLLNCLETSGVEVHYHCRDGFCGACRVTLVEGEIFYPNGEPLAFVGQGEILPCCCIPTSDIKLIIE